MAKRYSGDLVVQILYHDDHTYKGYVKGPGGTYKFTDLRPPQIPTAGHVGSHGIAYDSPKAYEEMAESAIAFATYDREDLGMPEYGERDGYIVHRPPSKKRSYNKQMRLYRGR